MQRRAKAEVERTPSLPLQNSPPSSIAPGCLEPGAEAQPSHGVRDAQPWKMPTEASFLNLQPKAYVSSLWFCMKSPIFSSPIFS